MFRAVVTHLARFVVYLIAGARHTSDANDMAIALLRHRFCLLQRRSPRPPRLSRREKLASAVLAARTASGAALSRRAGGDGHSTRAWLVATPSCLLPLIWVCTPRRRRVTAG